MTDRLGASVRPGDIVVLDNVGAHPTSWCSAPGAGAPTRSSAVRPRDRETVGRKRPS